MGSARCIAVVLALGVFVQGCAQLGAKDEGGKALLPPPGGDIKYSSYRPEHAFEIVSEGYAVRTVYRSDDVGPYEVEVCDFIAAPGKGRKAIQLDGAAVLEVRSGAGMVTAGDTKHEDVHSGSLVSIDDGQTIAIEATGAEPLVLRAYLVRSR